MKLKKKVYKKHKGKVYDIGVDTYDHSYSINGAVVHNSSAGCLVSYLLGIVQIDPLDFDLLFERFLTESRLGKAEEQKNIVVELEDGTKKTFWEDELIKVSVDNETKYIKAKDINEKHEL